MDHSLAITGIYRQFPFPNPILDLGMEIADISRLLQVNGPFHRIVNTKLESLPYQIEAKCDNCVFNTDCLPESARLRRIELLGIQPGSIRALRDAGILTID